MHRYPLIHNPEIPTHTQILSTHTHTFSCSFSVSFCLSLCLSLSLMNTNTGPLTQPQPDTSTLSYIHTTSSFIPCGPLRYTHTHIHHLDTLHYHLDIFAFTHRSHTFQCYPGAPLQTPLIRYIQWPHPLHTTQMHPHSKLTLLTQNAPQTLSFIHPI